MIERIDLDLLDDIQKQGLVCLFYSRLPKTDPRYKNRFKDWEVLEKRFNRKVNTYKNDKDAFDRYFDSNNRVGWQDGKSLDDRRPGFQYIYDTFKDWDDEELENAVKQIVSGYAAEKSNYVSMKCGFINTVHEILAGQKRVTIDGIYTLKEELSPGKIIFLTLGGDIGKAEVDWQPGFMGIAHVEKAPYDFGYNGKEKYFKIDIIIDCLFEEPFKREDFVTYADAYDAAYIGPELSRDPSQAISTIDVVKAIAVIRAILDKYHELEDNLRSIFGDEIVNRAKGAVRMMVPVSLGYGESKDDVISSVIEEINIEEESDEDGTIDDEAVKNAIKGGRNILYYGVPGSGKSFKIDEEIKVEKAESRAQRVVFHPDYTYSDLIGQIMPRLKKGGQGEDRLTYEFVPGPFTKILKMALLDPMNKYYLIIEEINRGNAPAIFGDVFQLLDRNEDGTGKYSITNFDIGEAVFSDELHEVRIPSNLSIYATMNTSDQNVFTLDTAFQRRWEMEYINNDIRKANHANRNIAYSEITWGSFALTVNEKIVEYSAEMTGSEDKQLGAYFVQENELGRNRFPQKALKYLWDDAFKLDHQKIFSADIHSIGELISEYNCSIEKNADPIKRVMSKEVYDSMIGLNMTVDEIAAEESAEDGAPIVEYESYPINDDGEQ